MSNSSAWLADPARLVLAAPLVFGIHVCEEAPGFVRWFNELVYRGIDQELFLSVNVAAFLVTLLVTAAAATARTKGSALAALAWLGFLMFANAVFHITGTLAHGRYAPGTVTAAVLYLPYFPPFARAVGRRWGVGLGAEAAITLLAGAPMFIHGYLIVFRHSRLF